MQSAASHEKVCWHASLSIEKYHERDGERDDTPYEVYEKQGNVLTYGGASALWDNFIGAGNVDPYDNTNAHLAVGNSSAATAATQTDLQGASKHYEPMDATYPLHSDGTSSGSETIAYRSTFETGDANFAWLECGLFNALSGGRMLNRFTFSPGTKTSSDSWVLTVTLGMA